MSLYTGAKAVVRTAHGNSKCFEEKVSMHQGSALSPLLLLYADDLVVIAESEDDLNKWLNEWKDNMENRGMKVNMN